MSDTPNTPSEEPKDPPEQSAGEEGDLPLPDFTDTPGAPTVGDAIAADETSEEDRNKYASDLAPVFDVPVHISAVLGKTAIDVNELLALNRGSVLELDRKVGEAIDVYVNNRLVARGEVVVVDERLGVTMTEIVKAGDTT